MSEPFASDNKGQLAMGNVPFLDGGRRQLEIRSAARHPLSRFDQFVTFDIPMKIVDNRSLTG